MKFTLRILHLFCLLAATISYSQNNNETIIRLGVKTIPNAKTLDSINNKQYNFIDAFEYELLDLLIKYANTQDNLKLFPVKINQNSKADAIASNKSIDALLFTFSKTQDRVNKGIIFSIPYFQNKGIGLISNSDDINTKSFGNKRLKIGYTGGTTSKKQIDTLTYRYGKNYIKGKVFNNHNLLIKALKNGDIDMAIGDISRLVFETNEGDLYFSGYVPTKSAKIGDDYHIGVSPSRPELKIFFDNFIERYRNQINNLETKWLNASLQEAYQLHYNNSSSKEQELKRYINQLKDYLIYGIIGISLLALVLAAIIYRKFKNKNLQIETLKEDNEKVKVEKLSGKFGEIVSDYELKLRDVLNHDSIAKQGINFFESAKKSITYVGSGGFLSDSNHGKAWKNALEKCLTTKPNFVFERVIDLPEMTLKKNGIRFKSTSNFFPNNLGHLYISKYIKWLFIQYSNLHVHKDKIKIINSRGAALWGYGIVIMIKDENEVLIFTTNEDEKIGTSIPAIQLAEKFIKVISYIKKIGNVVSAEDLHEAFFKPDNALTNIKERIDQNNGVISDDIMKTIDQECNHIGNTFNKEKNQDNNNFD